MLDDEKGQLKEEIKAELRKEMSSGGEWRGPALRGRSSILGLGLIIVGIYLILPSFGIDVPSFGRVVLPILLILGGLSLMRR